jgi:hypothetical protein
MMQHHNNNLGQPIGFPILNWKSPELPSGEPMEGRFCRLERLNPNIHAVSLHPANTVDIEGKMWTYLPYGPFATLDDYRGWIEQVCLNNVSC